MKMTSERLDGSVRKVSLTGSLDIAGAQAIELELSALAGSGDHIIVDLADVGFLASIGIRTLLTNAKTVQRRGGRFVLLRPQPLVREVLHTTGMDQVMPIYDDDAAALSALAAAT